MQFPSKKAAKLVIRNMMRVANVRKNSELGNILGGIRPQSISNSIGRKNIPDNWFLVFEEKYGVSEEELCRQPTIKAEQTETADAKMPWQQDQAATDTPATTLTPLKQIISWMNETFTGEIGEYQAMQFYDDLRANYPSFKKFIENKGGAGRQLAGPDAVKKSITGKTLSPPAGCACLADTSTEAAIGNLNTKQIIGD